MEEILKQILSELQDLKDGQNRLEVRMSSFENRMDGLENRIGNMETK